MTKTELAHVTRNYLRGCHCHLCQTYAKLEAGK